MSGEEVEALRRLEEARNLARQLQLWPEFTFEEIPIAVFDSDMAWLIHHPAPPSAYTPVEGPLPISTPVFVTRDTHGMLAATSIPIGGVETAILPSEMLLSASMTSAVALIFHEAFHAFQKRKGFADPENILLLSRYPETSAMNNALGRLEGQLLHDALYAQAQSELESKARQFCAVRHKRQARLQPELVEYEKALEAHEGVPSYIELKVLEALSSTDEREARLRRLQELCSGGTGAARQRFYTSGMAQALLLDQLWPSWKVAHVARRTLQDLLNEVVGLDPSAAGALFEHAQKAHNFPQILAEEERASTALQAARKQELDRLLNAEGQRWVIDASALETLPFSFAFDPMNVTQVDEQTRIHRRMLRLGWGQEIEIAFDRPVAEDTQLRRYITVLSGNVQIIIDGKQAVGEEKHYAFSEGLAVRAPGIALRARRGQIIFSNEEVLVQLTC